VRASEFSYQFFYLAIAPEKEMAFIQLEGA
jgi:hypothetical protein